eukprot:CAMPEP_0113634660 /NCGR_PEP_ID=MMETSP0017_2-20120614/18055_1 /TAXON_ID=2856 /ORGANISM="Cylindrotheca closterium" /LENGTH=671 /DNA_ID=CAMNT_0000545383 /DNA_START=210 /DNA_END=2222 /DNA_ORIENTATION=+ /assembly_acc=CAM_ASM_000147
MPPPSPSSVRWQYDNRGFPHKPLVDEPDRVTASQIPSREEMKRRWDFRNTIQEESNQHRRVYTKPDFVGHNVTQLLHKRSIHGSSRLGTKRLRHFAEYSSVTQYQSCFLTHLGGQDEVVNGQREQSSQAVSTISVAFSPCGLTMASTHGDHTVKITDCNSGDLLQTLVGHSRTPWTCKYHPLRSDIVASGCLGHQVRLWNWKKNTCLAMIRLEYAIISLSFHPSGKVLGVANGTKLNFWGLGNLDDWSESGGTQNGGDTRVLGMLTEVDQGHMLRCVHFPPAGKTVIVGGVNKPDTNQQNSRPLRGGISGGGMTFYLKLFDFNLPMTVDRQSRKQFASTRTRARALENPRVFVPRALLYNDGGFDVSPDGKTLCACAEYWLPDGVNNAMELLEYQNDQDEDDSAADEGATPAKKPQNDTPTSTIAAPFSPTPHQGSSQQQSADSSPPPGSTTPRIQYPSVTSGNPLRTPTPQTPPANQAFMTLSPPSPPGRRFGRGYGMQPGRYVPHVVTISLDTTPSDSNEQGQLQAMLYPPHAAELTNSAAAAAATRNKKQKTPKQGMTKLRPRLGQLLQACPLDGAKASAVTCVKFSPSTNFCLIGYGVREPIMEGNPTLPLHPVTALYATTPKMTHVSTMLSPDDDVNIARFHPHSGVGFCYGTKQGRLRVLGPRPW